MVGLFLTTAACLAAGIATLRITKWRKNYQVAQAMGFPAYYSPVNITDVWWVIWSDALVPILNLLPTKWTNPWLSMTRARKVWTASYSAFDYVKSDNFVLVHSSGNMLWTCDPQVINQLFNQPSTSHAAVDLMKFFDLYGPTVATTEGEEWRYLRRLVTSAFGSNTNAQVWKESLHQVKTLTEKWTNMGSVVPYMKLWTSRLSLHVISEIFFHKQISWDSYDTEVAIPSGYEMDFSEAMLTVTERLGTLMLIPRALLGKIRFGVFKKPCIAFTAWTKYITEMRRSTEARLDKIVEKKHKSILESIVYHGQPALRKPGERILTEEGVLGNIFFILLAGHETTGSTIAFILTLLALYPDAQKQVQQHIDEQLQNRSMEDWTLENDYAAFQKGYVGQVIKEVLRLYLPLQLVFRKIVADMTVTDALGKTHLIPKDTIAQIDFAAAFHNPNRWKQSDVSSTRRAELHNSPAIDFDPSRWETAKTEEGETALFFPFGLGPRSCPGKTFAQVEIVAIMAAIFKDYSIELVVDENTLRASNGDAKMAWEKTRDRGIRQMYHDIDFALSIYLSTDLPLRLVRRQKAN